MKRKQKKHLKRLRKLLVSLLQRFDHEERLEVIEGALDEILWLLESILAED